MILMFINYEPVPEGGGGAWMAYPVLIQIVFSTALYYCMASTTLTKGSICANFA
jgi:hypothetical protein